jgi:hypothetical protein
MKIRKSRDACSEIEYIVGVEVLIAMTVKGVAFWVVMACSLEIA